MELKINNRMKYEVVIIGGGMSGTFAGIAAARNGKRTLIVEQSGYFGGALTTMGVGPMMTFFAGEKQIIKGLGQEMVQRLKDQGYSPGHVLDTTNFISYVTPFSSEGLKIVLDEMVIESGAEFLFHTTLIGVDRKENRIESVFLVNKDGITSVEGKIFIDATGDADLSVLSGVPCQLGKPENHIMQPLTMNMKVSGVDTKKIREEILKNPEKFPRINRDISVLKKTDILSFVGFDEELKRAKEEGKITIPREDILFFETNVPGEIILNTTRIINKSSVSEKDLTSAEVIGRRQCKELFEFLVAEIPGFENIRMELTGPKIGVRSSRQIEGVYKLTKEDILKHKKCSSSIAYSGYPIDIHNPKGEGTISIYSGQSDEIGEEKFNKKIFNHYYGIPYEIMITKEVKNLIVTGRCVSAEFEAQAAIRLTPTMTALGQAAGTAAALALNSKSSVQDICMSRFREMLKMQGAYLE